MELGCGWVLSPMVDRSTAPFASTTFRNTLQTQEFRLAHQMPRLSALPSLTIQETLRTLTQERDLLTAVISALEKLAVSQGTPLKARKPRKQSRRRKSSAS
jgi:hypothetical protein